MLSEHPDLSITSSSLKESRKEGPRMLTLVHSLRQVALGNDFLETGPKVLLNHSSPLS